MKKIPVRQITSQNEAIVSGKFKIRTVEAILDGKDLLHDLHRHDFYFLLAIKKGEGVHEIDFTPFKVLGNSVFILRPGQVHQLILKAGSEGFLLEFDANYYSPKDKLANHRLIKAGNRNYSEFEPGRFLRLLDLLDYMFKEYVRKEEGYNEIIKAQLDTFFIEYLRERQHTETSGNIQNSYIQERYEDFLEELNKHINTHKQVSQYADLLNLSSYQLNSITKTIVGKAASEIINEHIILEAKRYLLATPNQVKDIADHLGYEDISYFIRFFKKNTGYTPESFRKNFQ